MSAQPMSGADISADIVKELLTYDEASGRFAWRARGPQHCESDRHLKTWNSRFAGKEAGTVNKVLGYQIIRLFGQDYFAHRIAWLYIHGAWPNQIDHINGNRLDNRICNLRNVDDAENRKNSKRRIDNKSGVCGVSWLARTGRWAASIRLNGRNRHLGYYADWFEAVCARKSSERELGFHKNHGRISK